MTGRHARQILMIRQGEMMMKRCLMAAAICAGLMLGACGQKTAATETAVTEAAATETAAETAVTETVATESAGQSETAALTETAAPTETAASTETVAPTETTVQAETETETSAQSESQAPVETQVQSESDQTEGVKVYSAAEIRESQNAMCAAIDEAKAAFGVLIIDPEFEGSWTDVETAIAFSGYAEKYPYLTSFGFEQYIETEGTGLVCIIPRDMQTSLSVDLVDEDLEVIKVLYRHEMAHPLLIRAKLDPERAELRVDGVSGDYKGTFYLMTEKGRLLMPNGGGVYDFTEE